MRVKAYGYMVAKVIDRRNELKGIFQKENQMDFVSWEIRGRKELLKVCGDHTLN